MKSEECMCSKSGGMLEVLVNRMSVQEPSESVLQVSMGYINPPQAAPWFSHWSWQ